MPKPADLFGEKAAIPQGMDGRISAFLLGIGLGMGLGVILAPKSGQETRDALGTRAREAADYVSQRGAEVADRAADLTERGERVLRGHKEKLTDVAESIASRF